MSTDTIGIEQHAKHDLNHWSPSRTAPARIAIFIYGLVAYIAFFITIVYAIGFVTGLGVPKDINAGTPGPLIESLLINGAFLVAFVLQHTIMARPAFKRWVTQFIPKSIERSTFVLAASGILLAMYWQWRPLPEVVWEVTNPIGAWAITGVCLLGFGIVLLSSFMVSHFDLFGLRQVWLNLKNEEYRPLGFRLVGLYRIVRHPLMVGFLIAFWATPKMTVGHLFFSVMVTGYIFVGIWFEERDLVAHFGEQYQQYRRRVRALLPIPRRVPDGAAD